MCGICGIFSRKQNIDREILISMRDTMIHRGPDGAGIYISKDKSIGLGHRRLKVIDLSDNANQPMTNENQSIWLVCNGEIYNFLELRSNLEKKGHKFKSNNDNEVIVHLYEEKGIDLIDDLDGDFTFAIWDEMNRIMYVVRDRLGIKPCFYFKNHDIFIFASELKAILQYPTIQRHIEPKALHHYLTFHAIPAPYTIYRDLNKLLPGHYMKIDDKGLTVEKYWGIDTYFDSASENKSESDYIEEFIFLFKNAIKKRLMSDVPLGMYLSGGVDSSSLVAVASEVSDILKTFSVTFGDEYGCDESLYSNEIAQRYHTEHHNFKVKPDIFNELRSIVKHFDEPFAIPSAVPMYILAKYANEHVKVVLTGDGGDEFFGGYKRYHWDILAAKVNQSGLAWLIAVFAAIISKIPRHLLLHRVCKGRDYLKRLLSSINKPGDERYISYLSFLSEENKRILYNDDFADRLFGLDSSSILSKHYNKISTDSILKRRTYADIMTTLPDEMLTKGDMTSMSSSLENRVPLLDRDLIKFAAKLPDRYKLHKGVGKYLIKKAMLKTLPKRFLFRRKMGFNIPLGIWLRSHLRWLIDEYLEPKKMKKQDIFNSDYVSELVTKFLKKQEYLEYHLYPLIIFSIWYDECYS